MENVDIMDKVIAIYGDKIEYKSPYIGSGHSGRTLRINRTEEARGSNPLRSTFI
jgi:signal peptidase I